MASAALAATTTALAPQEIVQRGLAATVYVKVTRLLEGEVVPSFGTGFFVNGDGTVLTSAHVVTTRKPGGGAGPATAEDRLVGPVQVVINAGTPGERTLDVAVLSVDGMRDLALLRVGLKPQHWLELAADSARLADEIWVFGYPFGELLALNQRNPEATVTSGRVTSVRHDEKGAEDALQIDGAVNPGNSGGPVLDRQGRVVGVVWAGITGGAATSFAVPLQKLQAFASENQVRVTLQPAAVVGSTPVRLQVLPLLRSLDGASGTFALSAQDLPAVSGSLAWREGRLEALIDPPKPGPGGSLPRQLRLLVRVVDSSQAIVVERSLTVPVEGVVPPAAAQAPAVRVAANPLAPAATGARAGGERVIEGSASVQPPQPGSARLASFAKGVKLKSSGPVSITDSALLGDCALRLRLSDYDGIPAGEVRKLAFELDHEVCQQDYLSRMKSASADGHLQSLTLYTIQWEGDKPAFLLRKVIEGGYEAEKAAKTALEALRLMAARLDVAEVCRCGNGRWVVNTLAPACGGQCTQPAALIPWPKHPDEE